MFVGITIGASWLPSKALPQKSEFLSDVDNLQEEKFDHYPMVAYNTTVTANPSDSERRRRIGLRYDRRKFVYAKPHPRTGSSAIFLEDELPPAVPTLDSDIVVVGRIREAKAYLSDSKGAVYSEFSATVEEVLWPLGSGESGKLAEVVFDRGGGRVVYPDGQEVAYIIAGQGLPKSGELYFLFLKKDSTSPNLKVLGVFELRESKVYPVDKGQRVELYNGYSRSLFIELIQGRGINRPQ